MSTFNPQQRLLLSAEYLLDINPLKKYELLFDNLDCSPLKGHTHNAKGSLGLKLQMQHLTLV